MSWSAVGRARCFTAVVLSVTAVAGALRVAASESPPELRLPPDIVYDSAKDSPGPVVFSHDTHVAIADNKCTGCHPAPFKILKPTGRMTHDDMNAGRLCGACHDGRTAVGVQDDCEHCHKPAPPQAAAAGAPAAGGGAS